MFPFASASLLQGSTAAALDTQTVTTGERGSLLDGSRLRGFDQATVIGYISDGTSNLYSGLAITALHWFEDYPGTVYILSIPGAVNSGWTKLTIGARELLRASATFSAGQWAWTTTDNAATQAFGGAGSSRPCVFT